MTATTDKLEASKKLAPGCTGQVFNQRNPGKATGLVTGDVIWHGGPGHWLPAAARIRGFTRTIVGPIRGWPR